MTAGGLTRACSRVARGRRGGFVSPPPLCPGFRFSERESRLVDYHVSCSLLSIAAVSARVGCAAGICDRPHRFRSAPDVRAAPGRRLTGDRSSGLRADAPRVVVLRRAGHDPYLGRAGAGPCRREWKRPRGPGRDPGRLAQRSCGILALLLHRYSGEPDVGLVSRPPVGTPWMARGGPVCNCTTSPARNTTNESARARPWLAALYRGGAPARRESRFSNPGLTNDPRLPFGEPPRLEGSSLPGQLSLRRGRRAGDFRCSNDRLPCYYFTPVRAESPSVYDTGQSKKERRRGCLSISALSKESRRPGRRWGPALGCPTQAPRSASGTRRRPRAAPSLTYYRGAGGPTRRIDRIAYGTRVYLPGLESALHQLPYTPRQEGLVPGARGS